MVARNTSTKAAPRAPASMRHDRQRKDRDGDLAMGAAIKGRAGISKAAPPAKTNSRAAATRGKPRGGIVSANAQREILKHVGAGDVSMKEVRRNQPRGLVELKLGNWNKSKASTNPDGGVSSLISWLEKKASNKLGSRARSVKVKKSRVEGNELIVSIPAEDVGAVLRLNGWVWAGTNITIQRLGGEAEEPGVNKARMKEMIQGVLERRYNQEQNFLDLSALGQDPELQAKAVFNQKSTTAKFFPAMMVVLGAAFDTPKERDEAIISVSLANNDLDDLNVVTTLSHTLPKLHNLDLSNNKFDTLEKLSLWRRRFPHLEHLIVSGNPFEQSEPEFAKLLMDWYPSLRMLNNIQVRTQEEINSRSKNVELSFPIRAPSFQDEGSIAENFVRTFFTGFDTDRATLANMYYDTASSFSYAVNTAAPRDPAQTNSTERQEWDEYIKHSRNLKKISHLPARQLRLFRGTQAVAEAFNGMPKSKHPDLASDPKKWLIEAHIQPGVPDPTGQSSNGVDGFMVAVHGEFDEVDTANGQTKKKRSFDRTFVIGPGGPTGVRVVSDMLTVRAYGGGQAFDPENFDGINAPPASNSAVDPSLPPNITFEVAEQMVTELQKQTRMTVAFAKECLEQVGWDFQMALQAFESVKVTLPPDAFVQGA